VADDWQRKGLARTLLGQLVGHATAAGIRRMAGDTIATNTAMVELARRSGFKVARKREDGRLTHLFKDLAGYGQRAGADRNEPAPASVNLCAAVASTRNPFPPSVPGGLP
jgi:GNAT superfamily N-acetyltransferase